MSMEHVYSYKWNIKVLCIFPPPVWRIGHLARRNYFECRANTNDDLIIRDFNARREWVDHRDNSKGTKLKNWMESNELERVDTGPSPMSPLIRGNSIVDHVFTNVPGVNGVTSDPIANIAMHRPIIGSINITAETEYPWSQVWTNPAENLKRWRYTGSPER